MARGSKKRAGSTVIIRREEVVEAAGGHSGAWKVAYADFVTAMMAFFLLMWLINATTEKQRRGLADYFSPLGPATRAMSGNGKPFGGLTPYEAGSLVSNRGAVSAVDAIGRPAGTDRTPGEPPTAGTPSVTPAAGKPSSSAVGQPAISPTATDPDAIPIDGDSHLDGASGRADATESRQDDDRGHAEDRADRLNSADAPSAPSDDDAATIASKADAAPVSAVPAGARAATGAEAMRFSHAADDLRHAVESDPAVAGSADQLAVDVTPKELRIQIIDGERRPMFGSNSAVPEPRARRLLADVAPVLARLGEPVSITGHTDSSPCRVSCLSSWTLSAARADAARAVLEAAGLPDRRFASVTGLADRAPLLTGQPGSAENRRIVMIVERRHPASASP